MSDCISRQAAIDINRSHHGQMPNHINFQIFKEIEALPSVEPERKTGKWEYVQYDTNPNIGNWHCSNCRLIVNFGFEYTPYYHYCPGCGAKMEVENE